MLYFTVLPCAGLVVVGGGGEVEVKGGMYCTVACAGQLGKCGGGGKGG